MEAWCIRLTTLDMCMQWLQYYCSRHVLRDSPGPVILYTSWAEREFLVVAITEKVDFIIKANIAMYVWNNPKSTKLADLEGGSETQSASPSWASRIKPQLFVQIQLRVSNIIFNKIRWLTTKNFIVINRCYKLLVA